MGFSWSPARLLLVQYTVVAARACHNTRTALSLSCQQNFLTVYSALSSSSTRRSIRAAALYLGIQQHMQAPELTNPARMPDCLGSSKVSKALAAAVNTKYAGQLQMNASVDTTYIQVSRLVNQHQQQQEPQAFSSAQAAPAGA